jgi:VIT1/CCC1 family predicted Fe2+/Mn2+ transporter
VVHPEQHRIHRVGWLRAAVLGANDGIVSTASLVIGVASASASSSEASTGSAAVLTAGIAGLVAGAMSMAAGEYVSVSSQRDIERAELELERAHIARDPEYELEELTQIYVERGVDPVTAASAARQMMEHDALAAHARDELGFSEIAQARPLLAAVSSGATFTAGAALPVLTAALVPVDALISTVAVVSLLSLVLLGALAANAGGANPLLGAARVGFWGAAAMWITAAVGRLFGAIV